MQITKMIDDIDDMVTKAYVFLNQKVGQFHDKQGHSSVRSKHKWDMELSE